MSQMCASERSPLQMELRDLQADCVHEIEVRMEQLIQHLVLKEKQLETKYHLKQQELTRKDEELHKLNCMYEQLVHLNVGGYKFSTTIDTLCGDSNSMLYTMFCGRHVVQKDKDEYVFIDRDGTHFKYILKHLRGNVRTVEDLPKDQFVLTELLEEADYYQLLPLKEMIKTKLDAIVNNNIATDDPRQLSDKKKTFEYCVLDDLCLF